MSIPRIFLKGLNLATCCYCKVNPGTKPLKDLIPDSKKGSRYLCNACYQSIKSTLDSITTIANPHKTTPHEAKDITKLLAKCKKYNITLGQYFDMVIAQNGQCLICGQKTKLVIDHNHITNEVRGLLCNNCNSGIGFLKLDHGTFLLERAISYFHKKL